MTRTEQAPLAARAYAGLAATVQGDPTDERPPLVLLHGLTFDRTMWDPALEQLAAFDPLRRALAFDLPGHGESPAGNHRAADLVTHVWEAVAEAGVERPVIVGHSMAAVVATLYAAEHPVGGVINVDQPLRVEPFAQLVHSIRDRLDSDAFPQVWQTFWDSMGIDQLPDGAQQLLHTASRPRRELVLSYWRDLLETPAHDLAAMMDSALATIRSARRPYAFVLGRELEPPDRQWLSARLPEATTTIIPGSGHFPHLGDPPRFANILGETADWRPEGKGEGA